MVKYIKASPDSDGYMSDEELDAFVTQHKTERDEFHRKQAEEQARRDKEFSEKCDRQDEYFNKAWAMIQKAYRDIKSCGKTPASTSSPGPGLRSVYPNTLDLMENATETYWSYYSSGSYRHIYGIKVGSAWDFAYPEVNDITNNLKSDLESLLKNADANIRVFSYGGSAWWITGILVHPIDY